MRWFGWFRRKKPASETDALSGSPYVTIGGRLHTAGIPYALPADLEEQNRLDFQHYLLRATFQGNYAAPLDRPSSILDVGCGTGLWAREMAQRFPQAQVVGLDVTAPRVDELASTQTQQVGLDLRPANYQFVAGNVLEGLPFPDASFDFVHMRLLVLALPHDRWPFVISELARVTRPGGWVESVEATTLERGGPAMDLLMSWIVAMLARRGIHFPDGAVVGERLRAAGLANVAERHVQLPFGAYGGRVGRLLSSDFFGGAKAFGAALEAQGIASQPQFEQVFAQARADTESPEVRCVSPFHIAFGQRTPRV
jgi:ubiquinone/menaquinone biosynthesis C-methylase UbiE